MEIDGKKIAHFIGALLRKDLRAKKKKKKVPKLVVFLIGDAPEQRSYVKIKSLVAKKIGIKYQLVQLKSTPSFEDFAHKIKETSINPETTGIIIQQPLPAQLSTESLFDYIEDIKEIEGHKRKTRFSAPLGLAVLTLFKYIFGTQKLDKHLLVDMNRDRRFFKKAFRNKKIVLMGRGITGGKPIGKTLTDAKINYIGINSKTPDATTYLKEADVIVTAVGKKVILPEMLKPGVVLINVGLRRENGRLRGDYDEAEIKKIASFYTPTPGGIGPIDVMYLYKNLIESYKLQK